MSPNSLRTVPTKLSDRTAMMKAGLILLTTVALLMAVVLCVTHLINKRTFRKNN